MRINMLPVRGNFSKMYTNVICQLCAAAGEHDEVRFRDLQEHLINCKQLHSQGELIDNQSKYDDIFSTDTIKQSNITILLEQRFRKKKKLEIYLNNTEIGKL